MEEAAPRGVHALSFASLAHKSFIKDVSFAYTEGEATAPQDQDEIQVQKAFVSWGWFVCPLARVGKTKFLSAPLCTTVLDLNLMRVSP